jgi:hypothetical protein
MSTTPRIAPTPRVWPALMICAVLAAPSTPRAALATAPRASLQPVERDSVLRIEVSLTRRVLVVLAGADTVRTAPVAIASGRTLSVGGRSWTFETPRGRRIVKDKRADPVWRPPDWHYAEAALEHGLRLKPLPPAGITLADGRRVAVRDDKVSIRLPGDARWLPLPDDEHIVFASTLYIPPIGTRNRELRGELGRFALDLGDGYLLHGTRDEQTIGRAVTHGCVRLGDADLAWLFEHVPIGTTVVIR